MHRVRCFLWLFSCPLQYRKENVIQLPRQITVYKAMEVATSRSHNQYPVCPPLDWRSAAYLRCKYIAKLSLVTCGMLSRSSWRAIRSWSLFVGSGCRRWTASTRTSQTCSIGDKSGEYAGQSSTWTFSSSRNSQQTQATWDLVLTYRKMSAIWRTKGRTIECSILSPYLITNKDMRCPWNIPAQTRTPPPSCATLHTTVTSAFRYP